VVRRWFGFREYGIAPIRYFGRVGDQIARLSGRGKLTLPASLRRQLGLSEGDVLTVRVKDGSIVLTPAVVTEVEYYTDERVREFEAAGQLSPEEAELARRAWQVPKPTA
jgi:antitoxin PrlF